MTITFPSFKSPELYPKYIKQNIPKWEILQWKVVGIIVLLEIARIIEDIDYPNTNWNRLMRNKGIGWIVYFFGLVIRRLVFKKVKLNKERYLFFTDCMYLLLTIIAYVTQYSLPASNISPPTIWLSKESVRFWAINLVVSTSYFYWYFQTLVMLSAMLTNSVYLIKFGGDTGIFLPTYLTIIFCVALYTYSYEKFKRSNFELEYESLQSEKMWKNVIAEFPEGVLILNLDKSVLHMNSAFRVIFNFDEHTVLKTLDQINERVDITIENYSQKYFSIDGTESSEFDEVQSISFVDFQNKVWNKWERRLCDVKEDYLMLRGKNYHDNKNKNMEIKFAFRKFGGNVVALFIFSDITERILIESLKQNIDYKNRLLASVSHELRTPLNANINFIDSALHTKEIPSQIATNFLVPASRSARYLLAIINDIVDYSQIQSESLRLILSAKSLIKTLKESIELIELQAAKKGIQIKLELPQEQWDTEIKTDHNRVMQVVLNLLSNALKFTFTGSITVRVRIEEALIYAIEVEDTGIGIKAEDKVKILKMSDPLRDQDCSRYTNNQGFGMGLVISEAIAKLVSPRVKILNPEQEMPRAIHFESEVGKGSKFWFKIEDHSSRLVNPYFFIPGEDKRSIAIPDFKFNFQFLPRFERKCICPSFLIADDDPFNLAALENILNSLGLKCDACYNGQEVLDYLSMRVSGSCGSQCKPYQMIFLDCNMPVMDGYTCMKHLLEVFQLHPQHKCPVVACTAAVQESERKKCIDCGMNDFCPKPINRNVVKKMIEKFSRRSSKELNVENLFEIHNI